MKVFVTGANGFVGQHAVARLAAAGHDVIGASIEGTSPAGSRPVRVDIRDHHVLLRRLEIEEPDAILHLAAVAYVPAARRDPRGAFETNANGTLNVLSAAAEATPYARVVLISSAEVYGPIRADEEPTPIREERGMAPVTLYGASKAAAEHLAAVYAAEGLDVVILRPFNHIGPGQAEEFVVSSFAHQIARMERDGGGTLRHGNLEAVRDFLDVRDIVRGYELALTVSRGTLPRGTPFNLCSGVGTSIEQLLDILLDEARVEIDHEIDPDRLRSVDVPVLTGDPTKFRDAVGFVPEFDLTTTLTDILNEARERVTTR